MATPNICHRAQCLKGCVIKCARPGLSDEDRSDSMHDTRQITVGEMIVWRFDFFLLLNALKMVRWMMYFPKCSRSDTVQGTRIYAWPLIYVISDATHVSIQSA